MTDKFFLPPIYVDFETHAIGPRPHEYPPKPVGLAYYDPVENVNEYFVGDDMAKWWQHALDTGRPLCMHNATFDLDVAEIHLGMEWPKLFHDTLILAFLTDCNVDYLSLKYLAEKWCGIEPDARNELVEWILKHIPKSNAKNAGAYICEAPVELVAKYAKDDVRMTEALFNYTWEYVQKMQVPAYEREIKLLKILTDNSRLGMRVNREEMGRHNKIMRDAIIVADKWIVERMGVGEFNVGSTPQLAKALIQSGLYHKHKEWPLTPKGAPRSNKVTVEQMVSDKMLIDMIRYRSYMETICGTYVDTWMELSKHDGRIHTGWNSVKGEFGGTRTGRLSGRPTLQTAPVRYPETLQLPQDLVDQGLLPDMPLVRSWLLPEEGEVLVGADYSGQELRLFAHFEGGKLAEQYQEDPRADLHTYTSQVLIAAGFPKMNRTWAKDVAFCILYGGGANKVAEIISVKEFREVSVEEVREVINAYTTHVATRLPHMRSVMKQRYRENQPFTTLGGRKVKGEPPKIINGRRMQFDYKMINTLIQGSAADQAKEAMVTYNGPGRLWLSAHDEMVITCKPEDVEAVMAAMTECMCNQRFPMKVPMIADCVVGNNYAELK
jgi:DNA polymerase I-like protein with 3'-5' exonuclease and polymerase domains